ncbi:prolipoprotein diacylglyceryl transferase [Patescibacteria group bacterium]|nr:prolipoprotein diacylglyceryl transferase [Patescibacteria group bacterium]
MHPILLEIGSFTLYSMWFMVALGIITGGVTFIKLAKQYSLKLNFILDHSGTILLMGIVCARALFVLKNLGYYFYQFGVENFLSTLFIWDKGLSAWGAILGVTLTIVYYARKEEQAVLRWMDILFISLMAAMVLSNIGAFMEGAINYGKETALPWGVKLEGPTIKYSIPIHPTQLYAALYTLILFLVSLYVFIKKTLPKDGDIFLFGGLAFAVIKFFEEFLRGDDVITLLWLREGQTFSLVAAITFGLSLLVRYNKLKLPKLPKLPKIKLK